MLRNGTRQLAALYSRSQAQQAWLAQQVVAAAAAGAATPSAPLLAARLVAGQPAAGPQQWRGFAGVTMPSPKSLGEIMKLQALADKSGEEIADIWLQQHSDPKGGRVGGVISGAEHTALDARARASPLFVLPLAKPGGGFLTLLWQYQQPFLLFTTVEEYKRYGGGAPPHLTLTFYSELKAEKDIVLVRGDIINDKVVNAAEANTLLELSRAFYADAPSFLMVHNFNHEPAKFDFQALLTELGHNRGAGAAPEQNQN